jgi:aquaporin Z
MTERSLPQKFIVEFIGTLALCFIGIGAIVSVPSAPQLNGGIVQIALAHGLVIAVMVSAVGHISGGHFNPAITVGTWVTQKIASRDAIAYLVAQVGGAIAGSFLIRVVLPEGIWRSAELGTPQISSLVSNGQGLIIEAMLTFFLVWVVMATAVDPEGSFGKIAGLSIGLTITLGILMGGAFTGGAINPARALGPMVAGGPWDGWWIYWVGPLAGGVVAASLYDGLILSKRGTSGPAIGDEPHAPHGWGAHGEDGDATITAE